ncbi:hypothetical protein ACFPM7_13235 [Actinokineospora guangxiensis]|uniref:PE family protein n=1 Tax=Actinokineospora guangxiensis TaxID=1490288 RepID=A0ABW0ENU3_9PSEU
MSSEGFTVALDTVEQCATITLPSISARLAPITAALTGPPAYDAGSALAVHMAHSGHVAAIARRNQAVNEALESTARALLEIVALYRRADGQD